MKTIKSIEDLKNTKIYLQGKEESVRIQELLFRLGLRWVTGSSKIYEMSLSIYINEHFEMRPGYACDNSDLKAFAIRKEKQMFAGDVIYLDPKSEFSEGDSVLVRNSESDKWVNTEFYEYVWLSNFGYSCIDGRLYRYCIPYKGNEHLLGTTKNKQL